MRLRVLINFVAFEIGWFAAVLGAAHNHTWMGVLVAILMVVLHLLLSQRPLYELKLLVIVAVIGTLWDSVLAANDFIRYPVGQLLPTMAPVWIISLWALFATTLNVSLVFLRGRPLLAGLFGAIGAPLSFLGGMRLHALQLPKIGLALLVLACGWALLMPLLVCLSARFDGVNADLAATPGAAS
jgi:Protein of unknown function (DUF2878)